MIVLSEVVLEWADQESVCMKNIVLDLFVVLEINLGKIGYDEIGLDER